MLNSVVFAYSFFRHTSLTFSEAKQKIFLGPQRKTTKKKLQSPPFNYNRTAPRFSLHESPVLRSCKNRRDEFFLVGNAGAVSACVREGDNVTAARRRLM